jgi:mRNA-degrading endonuclease toxin of MazEF toxin-antitoxin module
MNRGEVWLIDLGGQIGTRPVLILTRQNVLKYLNKVIVAEITTQGKGYPTEIVINQTANFPKPSFVQADNLHTVPKVRLKKFLGALNSETMIEVSQKVVLALELESALPDR